LLLGVITGLVALSGVVYTQWRADQRERERWKREREHEAAVWERDDTARLGRSHDVTVQSQTMALFRRRLLCDIDG
jgi:hypothetical protein